jgi:hypothetical protein
MLPSRVHFPDSVLGRPFLRVAVAVVVLLACAACGGGSGTPLAQPAPGGGELAPDALTGVPKPGGAFPFQPPVHQRGAWTQSFDVHGLGPPDAMQFYLNALAGDWKLSKPPAVVGHCETAATTLTNGCTYRAVWTGSSERLKVTAGPDGAPDGGTELNLVLSPVT